MRKAFGSWVVFGEREREREREKEREKEKDQRSSFPEALGGCLR
jgi:hypothetical protein